MTEYALDFRRLEFEAGEALVRVEYTFVPRMFCDFATSPIVTTNTCVEHLEAMLGAPRCPSARKQIINRQQKPVVVLHEIFYELTKPVILMSGPCVKDK